MNKNLLALLCLGTVAIIPSCKKRQPEQKKHPVATRYERRKQRVPVKRAYKTRKRKPSNGYRKKTRTRYERPRNGYMHRPSRYERKMRERGVPRTAPVTRPRRQDYMQAPVERMPAAAQQAAPMLPNTTPSPINGIPAVPEQSSLPVLPESMDRPVEGLL